LAAGRALQEELTLQPNNRSYLKFGFLPGLGVPPKYWNKKLLRILRDLPLQYGKAEEMNSQLQKMVRMAEDIVSFAIRQKIEDPVAFLFNLSPN
jgi:hypothetical protein